MKRTVMAGLVILAFTGWSWQLPEPAKAPGAHKAEAAARPITQAEEAPFYYEDYEVNPQVTDDRLLRNAGGTVRDTRGEAVLLKATGEQKRVSAGPVELTVREAKIFRYHPDESLIDFYQGYTEESEFPVAKLFIEVTNTSDDPVHLGQGGELETDTGEVKPLEDDIYKDVLGGQIAPGETKAGNVGVILGNPDAYQLTVRTGEVLDEDGSKVAGGGTFQMRLADAYWKLEEHDE